MVPASGNPFTLRLAMSQHRQSLTSVSLFTGAMGLDLGFERSGFSTVLALDADPRSIETVSLNRPQLLTTRQELAASPPEELLSLAKLSPGELDLVTAGPPCQPWSAAGKRLGFADSRSVAIDQLASFLGYAQPRSFVVETVAGVLWSSKNTAGSANGGVSAFERMLDALSVPGYTLKWKVLNAADYGVPQTRRRLFFVGLRGEKSFKFPEPTHEDPRFSSEAATATVWRTLGDALAEAQDSDPEVPRSPKWAKYIERIPPGGCWRDLPAQVLRRAMGGALDSPGGKTSFFRRLRSDRPSPTLVTSPVRKSSPLFHPDGTRPLSVAEYKTIQGFPANWRFAGPTSVKYRLIGNAVPIELSAAVATALRQHLEVQLSSNV